MTKHRKRLSDAVIEDPVAEGKWTWWHTVYYLTAGT